MASNITNRSRRAANLTHDWPTRQTVDDSFRKSPVRESNPVKIQNEYCCPGEERIARRYDALPKSLCHRQGDAPSDHDLYKLTEEKTSDEGSVTEIDTNDSGHADVRPTCHHQCEPETKKYPDSSRDYGSCAYGKCVPAHRPIKSENLDGDDTDNPEPGIVCQSSTPLNRNSRNFRNYGNAVNVPQALIALRKLERLKELQRRREHAEKFYSQEIRRLIGENFFSENTAIVTAPLKTRERICASGTRPNDETQPVADQRNRGGGYTKELEPYGTMTTTTRFNCGCFEETTIPIFSSTVGHVKKCESHRYQERPVPKSAPPYSQEFYRRDENPDKLENHVNPCVPSRTRGKSVNNCGPYRNSGVNGSRDLESWEDRKVQTRNRRSPRHLSPVKADSPTQKYSETSIN